MKKKDIFLFCPFIHDGGLEKTLKIYSSFLSKKFNVFLVTNTFNKKRLNILDKKVQIINFKNKFFSKNRILNNIYCILKTLSTSKKKLLIFSLQDHFFWCILKFLKLDFKLILRTQTAIINLKNKSEEKFLKKKFFLRKIITFFYKYADLVITFSNQNKLYLEKKIKVKNVKVIYNYFPKFSGTKRKKKIYNVFFIGRLVPDKDPIFFVKNCIGLNNKINFNINVVGKGQCLHEIEKICNNSRKKIKIYGFIENGLQKLNKKIDILCITSKFDGTPNVLGEAVSFKIPCLAPKNVGLSNLILSNGKSGYLYQPNSDMSFQNNLYKMLNNYDLAITKSKKAYKNLDKFNLENTLEKLQKSINEIL